MFFTAATLGVATPFSARRSAPRMAADAVRATPNGVFNTANYRQAEALSQRLAPTAKASPARRHLCTLLLHSLSAHVDGVRRLIADSAVLLLVQLQRPSEGGDQCQARGVAARDRGVHRVLVVVAFADARDGAHVMLRVFER